MSKVITTSEAPAPVGAYSQAIRAGATLYCAGQIALDPRTGELVTGGIGAQTRRVLENLRAVLIAEGMSLGKSSARRYFSQICRTMQE